MSLTFRTLTLALALAVLSPCLSAKDQLRPAVGKPLQDAQKLMKDGQASAALAEIDKAARVGKLSDYESFIITQMRGSALSAAGKPVAAAVEFEKVLAAGRLPQDEALRIREALVGTYLRAKQYPKAIQAIQAYEKAGGSRPDVLAYLPQAYYLAGDFPQAATESAKRIQAMEKAGKKPTEQQLQIFASSYAKSGNMKGYSQALERMVRYYPKPQYWADVIQRTARKPGFSRSLDLDVMRLLRATDNLKAETEYMEMAQLALQANLPGEAKAIVEEGARKKILGQGDARSQERQGRLKKLITDRIAEDRKTMAAADAEIARAATGDPLVRQGLAYVTYGNHEKGLKMMEQGIAKGGLKAPDIAKLHLGYAYFLAGDKAKANDSLKSVGGSDGSRDFARLWRILIAQS